MGPDHQPWAGFVQNILAGSARVVSAAVLKSELASHVPFEFPVYDFFFRRHRFGTDEK
jgi:hypothetical protein